MDTSISLPAASLCPVPAASQLHLQYVGRQLKDVQPPAAIIDVAIVRRNCKMMLEAVQELEVEFRAHIKTHKTIEITKFQVGDSKAVKLVCSTVAEIESLLPWLLECISSGRAVNVLYGLPISQSQIPRLARLVRLLGEGSVGLFVDHPAQITALDKVDESVWPGPVSVWISIDVGYHREGVASDSAQLAEIAHALSTSRRVRLAGLYSHYGSSYGSSSPEEALEYMATELRGLREGADSFLKSLRSNGHSGSSAERVVLSLGATPTATSTYNLLNDSGAAQKYSDMLQDMKKSYVIELHAGVYPLLDMQQLATRARPWDGAISLSYSDIGFRVLAEVASLYLDRDEKPEALIAAGSIVLGREPCKSYDGWAVVTPWPQQHGHHYDPEGSKTGWIVGRISQEHGILTWEGPKSDLRPLEYGQKIMLWPNHACIAGVNFGFYLVVDSDTDDADRIRDVWIRCRGW